MADVHAGRADSDEQAAAFELLLEGRQETVQNLARGARALVIDVMPEVLESIWPGQGTASYGTGPKKMSEHFVYFTFAAKHLGLGFYYGAELDDPEGLLEGTGKKMRRVKISEPADLGSAALRTLIEQASTHGVPPLD